MLHSMRLTRPALAPFGIALLALLALAVLPVATGCGGGPEEDGDGSNGAGTGNGTGGGTAAVVDVPLPSRDWNRELYFREALTTLDEDERMAYFDLESDVTRELYLREIGADARVDLRHALAEWRNQPVSVAQIQAIFSSEMWDPEPLRFNATEVWSFRRFNGQGYTRITVELRDGVLVDAASYSEQLWAENQQILAECSRIERELEKWLEPGTALTAVPGLVEEYPMGLARTLAAAYEEQATRTDESEALREAKARLEATLPAYEILGERANPRIPAEDMEDDPVAYYALSFVEPDEKRYEGRLARWIWYFPFGEEWIRLTLEFRDRELHDLYCDPVTRLPN